MRPPIPQGRRPAHQANNKLLLAFAFILLPWLSLADAQQQQSGNQAAKPDRNYESPPFHNDDRKVSAVTTIVSAVTDANTRETPIRRDPSQERNKNKLRKRALTKKDENIIQQDESALATVAPAEPVRAHLPRFSSSYPASGLTSPHSARNLADWEVEDFVLLATVDGDLYANDRKTGKELWHLEVDQPMVETIHHRYNKSVKDVDYNPVDHYIWAVEPSQDGSLYIWMPDSEAGPGGLTRTSFTMKTLVEELCPYQSNVAPYVAYMGDKKTTMVTLDAATGRVLKWFGSSGSHVNQAESCFQKNSFQGNDEECSTVGTITLGRTEYTVGIQREDGQQIATLKYSEWGPNNFDSDLFQQYHKSIDSRYMASQPDGGLYAFDQSRADKTSPYFKHTFAAPVARVLDVCRPWNALSESNPQLIVLPQPPMPSKDETVNNLRSSLIFLNQTEAGDWYAMSGRAYPMIIDAPSARAAKPDWWPGEFSDQSIIEKALVGTHSLNRSGSHSPLSLGPGHDKKGIEGPENESQPQPQPQPQVPTVYEDDESTIVQAVKALPQSAMKNFKDFIANPVLIILLISILVLNQQKLRQSYHRLRRRGVLRVAQDYLAPEDSDEDVKDIKYDRDVKEVRDDEVDEEVKEIKDVKDAQDIKVVTDDKDDDKDRVDAVIPDNKDDKSHKDIQDAKDDKIVDIVADEKVGKTAKEDKAIEDEAVVKNVSTDEPHVEPVQQHDAEKTLPESPTTSSKDDAEELSPTSQEKAVSESADNDKAETQATPGKKKARRGRRGGVKHKKHTRRENSQSRDDEKPHATLDETVNILMKPDNPHSIQPDVRTIGSNDMQSVNGPVIRMGNIEVDTDKQLGTGSNGTLVFAGRFDGRDVAVKRMLIQFYDIASQETRLLRESDDHPNVIRYYSQVTQDNFLYIALERCAASLADVVERPNTYPQLADAGRMDLPGVLYQITNGISHLHSLRIVHRDLKPQNILVNVDKEGKPRLMVSDFGLCKKMEDGQSSFGATTGRAAGTSGWRAPELLLDDDARDISMVDASMHSASSSVMADSSPLNNSKRATRAIDIFSLGLVFYYVLSSGSHPFDTGGRYMREVNIRKGNYNLDALEALGDFSYEAQDLIASMIDADPRKRPNTREIMSHPFFWSPKKRLAFLCDVSDHFEKEPRDPPSPALEELERHAYEITKGDFQKMLPREFLDSLGKQRKYTGSRLLDLLRALRNKRNHYEDMSDSLRRTVGPLPEGYLCFWTVKFPMLLIACWNVVYNVQWEETDRFKEYYEPSLL